NQMFAKKNWPTSQEAGQKKNEGETKMKAKTSRGIAMKLICCMAVVLLVGITSFAQRTGNFPPTSGAMLEINGSVGGSPIDVKISDSQIHSTVVQAVPTANGNGSNCGDGVAFGTTDERVPTDAYVLQGGSPTGCDPGDNFEVTDNNPNTPRQAPGVKANFFGFRIETHYKENTAVSISG